MKPTNKLLILVLPFLFCITTFGQSTSNYDSVLAKKLGADEYGMKNYVFVILKSGKNTITDKAKRDSIFRGHLANIRRLADNGDLVLAGPFGDNANNYRGLFIFNAKSTEEIKKMLETDPAVKSGLLDPELYPWYGSAAVQQVNDLHKKIAKTSF